MSEAIATQATSRIRVRVIGQEADEETVLVNVHQHCAHLLREGLKELYGTPVPNPDEYDLVLGGRIIEPLSQTIAEAGIGEGASVSILPKTISRGGR